MAKKVDRTSGLSFRPVYQNQLFRILLDLAGIPPPATVLERPSYRDRIPAPAQRSGMIYLQIVQSIPTKEAP